MATVLLEEVPQEFRVEPDHPQTLVEAQRADSGVRQERLVVRAVRISTEKEITAQG